MGSLPTLAMKITTFDPKKNKMVTVGILKDRVFTKKVNKNHFMVKEQGYGIQQDVLEKLMIAGCDKITLKTKTKTYCNYLSDWITKGNLENYEHGPQVFLNKKYYTEA